MSLYPKYVVYSVVEDSNLPGATKVSENGNEWFLESFSPDIDEHQDKFYFDDYDSALSFLYHKTSSS